MNIRDAVIAAMKEEKHMYRKSEKDSGLRSDILPTNTFDCCLLVDTTTGNTGKRWNPNANDLMANDWKFTNRDLAF